MHQHRITIAGWIVLAATLASGPSPLQAQDTDARELYYQSADPDLDRKDAWLGIRTSILLASSDRRRARLRVREVSDQARFHSGDRFRLSVQANLPGRLYIFVKDSDGKIQLLFPYERGEGTNKVRPFRTRQVPEEDWFRFDQDTGTERIYLFLSRKPIRKLERAAGQDQHFRARDIDRLLEDAGDNEWKLFDEPDEGGETLRTYYVERPESRDAYLVRAFDLEHR